MRKKGPTFILLLTFLVLVVFLILEITNRNESNVTEEETEKAMKEFEIDYNTNYLTVVLENGESRKIVEKIAKKYNAQIVTSDESIKTYKIKFDKALSGKESLELLDVLRERNGIAYVEFPLNERLEQSYFNSDNSENDAMFENALNEFGAAASVYYDNAGVYTFLYPADKALKYTKQRIVIGENEIIIDAFVESPVGVLEEVAAAIIGEVEENAQINESYMMYALAGKTIVKWFDGGRFNSLIQTNDGYYKVTTENEADNTLITNSFYINDSKSRE